MPWRPLGARTGKFFGHGENISNAESRARVAEAIALIKLAWTQERLNFQGRYWSAENLPVLPQPVPRRQEAGEPALAVVGDGQGNTAAHHISR